MVNRWFNSPGFNCKNRFYWIIIYDYWTIGAHILLLLYDDDYRISSNWINWNVRNKSLNMKLKEKITYLYQHIIQPSYWLVSPGISSVLSFLWYHHIWTHNSHILNKYVWSLKGLYQNIEDHDEHNISLS